jgi:hypothetical protein
MRWTYLKVTQNRNLHPRSPLQRHDQGDLCKETSDLDERVSRYSTSISQNLGGVVLLTATKLILTHCTQNIATTGLDVINIHLNDRSH